MHKIKEKFLRQLSLILLSSVFMSGCSAENSREILLEDAESEVSAEEEKTAEEEASADEDESAENDAEESSDSADSADESGNSGSDAIFVYICGEVVNPGVYEMESGDRVYALIAAAGGLTEDADEAAINQAELLSDEQMVYIYSVEEEAEVASETTAGGTGSSSGSDSGNKVNINTATLEELTTLSGIGETKAQSIITYREENGNFSSIEDIMNVDGIKEGTYSKIKDDITV